MFNILFHYEHIDLKILARYFFLIIERKVNRLGTETELRVELLRGTRAVSFSTNMYTLENFPKKLTNSFSSQKEVF